MRKRYLDNIRWAVVVVVVVYHVFYMYNAEGVLGGLGKITKLDVQYYDLFLYIVYPWLMPVLFLVSGVCTRLALEKMPDREYFKSRTTKLLVPGTVGLFVFQFIQGWISIKLGGGFDTMEVPGAVKYLIMALSGQGVLWYIQLLWVLTALLLLIRKLEKDRLWTRCGRIGIAGIALLALPVWGAAQVLNTPVVVVYRFGFYGLVFLLGYFVFSHDETIELLKRYFIPLLLAAVALGIAFCAVYFGQNYADAPVNRTPLFVAYAWFGSLAILGGAAKYADLETAFTRWMGARSFGLYVFHYLGVSAVALFLAKPGLVPPALAYLLSLIAGFAVGYLLNALISRLPFFRWAVLGIKKERKHV
ncbi:MAG: acyltransferase [Eubacteriales bacterium]|nr:acyltransferase [Eubacteriales bacterium]